MTKKKPIKCDCGSICIEVRKAIIEGRIVGLYPKIIGVPERKRNYNEYRYACPECRKEFIHDTHSGWIEDVPDDSHFVYDWGKGLLVLNDPLRPRVK